MIDIGSQIKKYRHLVGITQKELGKRICVRGATIARYEKGDRTPRIDELQYISKALGIELGELLGIFDTTFPKYPAERLQGVPQALLDAYVLEVIRDFMKERDNNEIHL